MAGRRWPGDGLFLRRAFFNDEERLARLDEAEFAARDLFDRRGVVAQPPRLIAEVGILAARGVERLFDGGEVAARLEQGEEPFSPKTASMTRITVTKTST